MQRSERTLYLAVPIDIHDRFKEEPLIAGVLEDEEINTLVYNQFEQKIEKWIK